MRRDVRRRVNAEVQQRVGQMFGLPRPRIIIIGAPAVIAQLALIADDTFAHPAWGIVIDKQGQIYFSDVVTDTVWKLSKDGRL